jgi:hypothetical protein
MASVNNNFGIQMTRAEVAEPMTRQELSFTWSDAWVLAAVAVGGGMKGAGLREIIAAGDLINRAILTGPMLRSGLAKLIHKGYVRVDGTSFVVAGDARAAIARSLTRAPSSFSVMQFFEDFLAAASYTLIEDENSEWRYDAMTDERVDRACNEYLAEITDLRKR